MSDDKKSSKSVVSETSVGSMLKKIDKRIAELKKELEQLRKQRYACEVLLNPEKAEIPSKSAENYTPSQNGTARKRQRAGLHQEIADILRTEPNALTTDEIVQRLTQKKGTGWTNATRPESTVYVAVARHPELFQKSEEGGKWQLINKD